MNSKNIAKSCKKIMDNWIDSIDDRAVKTAIRQNAMITGGALVSLLTGEKPNDYDVYFKTLESCRLVAQYYADKWNADRKHDKKVSVVVEDGRIQCRINFGEKGDDAYGKVENGEIRAVDMPDMIDPDHIDDDTEPYATENEEDPTQPNPEIEKPKYRPRYFTTNAISLSDSIQIVIRFVGSIDQIHENYDFEHCKCSYDYQTGNVNLPVKALECIINKELVYSGSKYPLCSIIRTRKFITRGWKINAGQYVKMALQLNELDLKDIKVFKEQLVGVDSAYFEAVIEYIENKHKDDPNYRIDNAYIFEVINRIF